jgi:hypothetical protein
MPPLLARAAQHGLFIVEDAAQSIGSRYAGRMSGSFGHVAAFSAHPLKNLNAAGDAGFLATNDAQAAERVRRLRNHGLVDRNTAAEWSIVAWMDTLQASVLATRLPRLGSVIERRRANAALPRGIGRVARLHAALPRRGIQYLPYVRGVGSNGAMPCRRIWRSAASARPSTIRSRSISSLPPLRSAMRRATSPSPSSRPGASCRCRSINSCPPMTLIWPLRSGNFIADRCRVRRCSAPPEYASRSRAAPARSRP